MPSIANLSSALAPVIAALHSADFPEQLAVFVRELVGADDATLLHYRGGSLPTIAYSTPPSDRIAATLDTYLTGPFLLDPFYRAAAYDRRYGVFQMKHLAPVGFKESEYYRTWYRSCGFLDECGLLIKLDNGFLNLALGGTGVRTTRFSKAQVELLDHIFPLIEGLARHHWQETANDSRSPTSTLREQLHTSLAAFGSSLLTRRERQVTELVLLGNSTRIIAEKLGISSETVKLHRKHAYAKLDVSSQAELFFLFMEALAHSPDSGDVDPLIAYQSKPA